MSTLRLLYLFAFFFISISQITGQDLHSCQSSLYHKLCRSGIRRFSKNVQNLKSRFQHCATGYCEKRGNRPTCVCSRCDKGGNIPFGSILDAAGKFIQG
ncbi:Protein CBG09786 [Caenorhabditis briggsae]|uniref:Protein CBG09786 n=1 Tax=Caenorhabditis briggsae TaxID=6238 RepID=A8X9M6_CAEBR|nr:Protein CBG09786 [Caenorhabditis briggsae]CAP29341.2 Protein CBG09786 [Caenorhabditis briggsae]